MSAVIHAELRKFFSTRLWWGMAIAVVVTGAGFAAILGLILTSRSITEQAGAGAAALPHTDLELARNVYSGGIQVGYLLTLAIGIMVIGTEYRHQTITSTFLAAPRRARVMGAKVATLLVLGAFYGLLSLVGSVVCGAIILTARGHAAFPEPAIWRTLALCLLVLGLWALIGLGAGILIPNQVAALLIAIGIAWIVEPVLAAVLAIPSWGRHITPYLPSQATSATLGTGGTGFNGAPVEQLSWWAGALVLTGYAAVLAGLGTWRTLRADIS